MKYRCYPEYKDSGVAWLGEVPAHWEVRRLKFVARYQNSNVDKKSYEGQKNVRLCNYTDVYYNEKITNNMDFMVATATDAEIKSMSLKEGDVVITKDSEDPTDIGVPALVSEPLDNVVCGYHLTVLRAKNQDAARYLHRAIQSHPTRAHFFVESPGVTRFGLNQDAIGGLVMPVPPIVERKKIAAFLDEKTTQIDQLIEKKTRFIELLKEKRAALITEAVTGKFDVRTGKPYAEYKDSGVEWLGEVPSHWEVKRFKNLARLNPPKSEISNTLPDIEVQFIPMEMVSENGKVSLKETRPLSEVYQGLTYFRDGDVIMAKITPCFENGKGAIVDNLENGIGFGSTEFHVLRPASGVSSYIWYITKSIPFRKIGIMEMKGVAGQQRVPESFVSEFIVAVPPVEGQTTIATFLDKKNTQIDQLIEKTQQSIDLLKEKRAALITAAVTGKIDVRDYNERNAA